MNQDLQIQIFSYLQPMDIFSFYKSSNENKKIINELSSHVGFNINCKGIIFSSKLIKWFKTKNINLNLLREHINTPNGEFWLMNGIYHRDDDLPAVILRDGKQTWYQNGKKHRENGLPAVIFPNGSRFWYQNGKKHRDNDLPAVYLISGNLRWYCHGKLHRDNDLPAVVFPDGSQMWYKNGILHREFNNLQTIEIVQEFEINFENDDY